MSDNSSEPLESSTGEYQHFALLANAIAGRKVGVFSTDEALSYADGDSIFLCSGLGDRALAPLVAQATLIGLGSLDPALAIHLVGEASASRRYVTLELSRALRSRSVPVPRRVRNEISDWSGEGTASAAESLDAAMAWRHVPLCPEELGTVRGRKVLAREGGVGMTAALTKKQLDGPPRLDDAEDIDDDEDSGESKILSLFSSPSKNENPLLKMLRKQMGTGKRPKDAKDGSGAELPTSGAKAVAKVSDKAMLLVAPPGMDLGVPGHQVGDRLYPEWDHHKGKYRSQYCAVGEFQPAEKQTDERFSPVADQRLVRQIASLGLALERHRRLRDGDGLDISALVDFGVSKALGSTPDGDVYQARFRTERDLGVVVLVDASGSTAQRSEGGSVWDKHRQLSADLISSLERAGDRVAAYGFNSQGRSHVRFLQIKEFDHRFDAVAHRRLVSLQPAGFTRLGAAIRHSVHVVQNAGTTNKLIVVVSDGFAYDDGYEGQYAEKDTRRALDEALRSGVACVCVSVASDTRKQALDRLWGNTPHVQLDDPSGLSAHIVPMIRTALKSAESAAQDHHNSTRSTRKVQPV